jgi:hypothetical protein
MSWKDHVELRTGGWFNLTRSTRIAYGFGYIIHRTETGNFVAQAQEFGDNGFYELDEPAAFNFLMRHNKGYVAGQLFPQMYSDYLSQGQR